MNFWDEIKNAIAQNQTAYENWLRGGHKWERSPLYTAVYAVLVNHDLMPYEVASKGDPYELVSEYLLKWYDQQPRTHPEI